ncbi:MAG: hypothetical protein KAG89_20160 [Fulvimarina manganoxydans]|uniref:hypothetical protein n=1 Tax=Fulvimarina manganoxydans TaxID=937218 RepID=UPI0023547E76|nr:hypothetical protein [Fulvimarina manganoxydans]MCK5934473.1 hypothetical protein [Fulvimarina manganoxydans]
MKAFTETEVQEWREAAKQKPSSIPPGAYQQFPQARSFDIAVHTDALLLRISIGDGDLADVRINPVVARNLMAAIMGAGIAAGWLNDLGDIVFPDLPSLPDET